MRMLLAAWLLVVVGCSRPERLEIATADDMRAEIDRVAATLSENEAAEFRTAADVMVLHTLRNSTTEKDQETSPKRSLDGKTAAEVVAEFNELDAGYRTELASEIAEARTRAQEKKAANDHLERAITATELLTALDPQPEGLSIALANMSREYDKQVEAIGRDKAAAWFDEQLAGKTPEQIIEAWGEK